MPRKKKSTKKTTKTGRPSFHEDLQGFDIKVNSFGEMESSFEIDRINEFLNKEVPDKKLEHPTPPNKHDKEEEE
jgi:hypothetical protein